jgi:uncharacterized SAM-binding protein YcdF (DUF218 family)
MLFSLTKILSAFLMPPLNLLMLGGLGILLLKSYPRLARALLVTSWLLLFIFSMPVVAGVLRRSVETIPALAPSTSLPPAEAIVVLAGGVYRKAPEYGGDTVDGYVLERLRYVAKLYRQTHKPILVTGGSTHGDSIPESRAMKDSLENDFHIPVQWIEEQSRTTQENASYSAAILRKQGIHTVYLVTHATHMPRALQAFIQEGLQVVPAPTMFSTAQRWRVLSFLPTSGSLDSTAATIHEWVGQVWYVFANDWLWK